MRLLKVGNRWGPRRLPAARNGLALTHEALTQNPANAATMPSKAGVGAQERPERDAKRAFTQAGHGDDPITRRSLRAMQ